MLKLDLVSPSGQMISGRDVSSLTIPSAEGEINVLPGHVDMICTLGKGPMIVDGKDRFVVYGGILEVSNGESITVAADRVRGVSELNINQLKGELKDIENRLVSENLKDPEYNLLMSQYDDIKAEISSVQGN